jgi:MFS family permease
MAIIAVPVSALASLHFRALGRAAGPLALEPPEEKQGVLRTLAGAGSPFWWLIVQRLFVQAAYTSITVYAVFYLVRRTGQDAHDAGQLVAVASAIGGTCGVLVAVGGARFVARRVGYRAALSLGILCLLWATALMSLSTSRPLFVVAHVFAGTGLGIYLALDLVVALALLPRVGNAGRVLGYFQAARKVPQSLVPAVGPWLLAIGSGDVVGVDRSQNYFALLAAGTLLALLALALVSRLTVPERDDFKAH